MKITNDILKDYFYDKCSHEEEIEIQKWYKKDGCYTLHPAD